MAGTSLIALIDDVANVLDDIALLTKTASKKTAGVLGDDLALNAQQVTGVRADRELPVVLAVAKGSALNKAMLVPAALLISAFLPWLVTPLLMLGGLFLCYEGFEKLAHWFVRAGAPDTTEQAARLEAITEPARDMVEFERNKIKGAVRTDFILSAEIITIALGTVAGSPLLTQIGVLTIVAALMTLGVYGLVAGIVKLDDAGLYLSRRSGNAVWARGSRVIGQGILQIAPHLMKGLSIGGTAAMFLVGGGILLHGLPTVEHWVHQVVGALPGGAGSLITALANALAGIVAGGSGLAVITVTKRLWRVVR